jgi:hypothetical protein
MWGIMRVRWLLTLLPRTINYFFSEKVPFYYKFVLLIPVLWFFTPIARLANALPLLALVDDFTIILLTMALFTYLVGHYFQRKQPRPTEPITPLEIIEGEYYVLDQKQKKSKEIG